MTALPWPDHHLTLDEWDELPEDKSRRLELAEGVLQVAPRPVWGHQNALWRLAAQLAPQVGKRWGVLTEAEIVLDYGPPATIRVPDVLVASSSTIAASPSRGEADDAVLAIEVVSYGSRRLDRITKLSEYAEAGIPYYWIITLDHGAKLTAYRLVGSAYEVLVEGYGQLSVEFEEGLLIVDLPALTDDSGFGPVR